MASSALTTTPGLEIRRLDEDLEHPLANFFLDLKESGDEAHFHPHPLNEEEARRLAGYCGKDLYYVIVDRDRVLGYGMLRGWDEGYKVPSLGIAIHPLVRGKGLGKLLVEFLHAAARWKGAEKIRLKVYPDNMHAVRLYEKLGYIFQDKDSEQLVGFIDLS